MYSTMKITTSYFTRTRPAQGRAPPPPPKKEEKKRSHIILRMRTNGPPPPLNLPVGTLFDFQLQKTEVLPTHRRALENVATLARAWAGGGTVQTLPRLPEMAHNNMRKVWWAKITETRTDSLSRGCQRHERCTSVLGSEYPGRVMAVPRVAPRSVVDRVCKVLGHDGLDHRLATRAGQHTHRATGAAAGDLRAEDSIRCPLLPCQFHQPEAEMIESMQSDDEREQ